ncbi:hypothetical protein [Corynebacterium sp. 335C]
MADRDGMDLSQVPDHLLRMLSRLEAPTVEDIRRRLPPRFHGVAEEAHARLLGRSGPGGGAVPVPSSAQPEPSWQQSRPQQSQPQAPQQPQAPFGAPEQAPFGRPGAAYPAAHPAPGGGPAPAPAAAASAVAAPASAATAGGPRTPAMNLAPPSRAAGDMGRPFMDPGTVVGAANEDFAADDSDERNRADAPGITVRYVPGRDGERGAVRVRWDRPSWIPDGMPVIYRVVSADREFFTSPEDGDDVTCVTGPRFEEPAPEGTGFRHYQVWANFGPDVDAIYGSQPRFVGEDVCILPVPGLQLVESQGVVEGRWENVRGFDGIRIEAWPVADRQATETIPVYDGQHQFSHVVSVRGATMRFRIRGEVAFRGTTRVDPRGVQVDLDISADLVKVELTDATYHSGEREEIEFSWSSPPSGSVRVFFTPTAPDPDLGHEEIDRSALERELTSGSMRDKVLAADEDAMHGSEITRRMVWPHLWDTVYVTPVSIVDEWVFVGTPRILQRVQGIRNATLVERVSSQLITFEWPAGATEVKVESAEFGASDSERVSHGELDRAAYARDGGVRRSFSPYGERVILTPRAFNRGQEVTAEPTELIYPGLEVYQWALENDPLDRGALLRIWKRGGEDRNPPKFRLVRHHRRLPLSIADARTEGGGFYAVTRVDGDGMPEGAPGTVVTPRELSSGDDPGGWLLTYDELRSAWPAGQWYRLLIVEEEDPAGGRRGVDLPRRIVVDDALHNLPYLPAGHWGGGA